MRVKEIYANAIIGLVGIWCQVLATEYTEASFIMRAIGIIIGDACLALVVTSLTAEYFIRNTRNAKF